MDDQQERSLAWVAGIIDGEGSITFQTTFRKDGNLCICPFICVVNSDEKIIQAVSEIFQTLIEARKTGTVFVHNIAMNTSWNGFKSNKRCRNVRVNGEATRPILDAVLPYLRSDKRKNAEAMIKYLDSRKANLLTRLEGGRLKRGGYTLAEIELATSLRTHKLAKSSETLRSAPNVIVG